MSYESSELEFLEIDNECIYKWDNSGADSTIDYLKTD